MKKIIASLLFLVPLATNAQTIPLSDWPHIAYCADSVNGAVYVMYQTAMPVEGGASGYEYINIQPNQTALNPRSSLLFSGSGDWTSNPDSVPTDCDNMSISQLLANNKAFYFVRSSTPATLPDQHSVRKAANESVSNSVVLQDDDALSVPIIAGKSYIVTGILFASATNATPDIKVAFTAPSGSDMTIGYTSNAGAGSSGELDVSGVASARIPLPANTKVPIRIDGTVVAGANGTLQLQWAQFGANAAPVSVNKGSYIRVTEIQQ